MPMLEVQTNVDQSKLTSSLASKLVEIVAKALGKPKSYVVVSLKSTTMSWGGDADGSTAIMNLSSIGCIDTETNKKTSAVITDVIVKELGIPKEKIYINFINLHKDNVGYMGTTFADIL